MNLFSYSFMLRGLEAGIIIGLLAPLVGMFLVLRRYSLITDTLAHVSFAGVALGLFLKLNPFITALGVTTIASIFIEKLRSSKKLYAESALSLFLSGSLALAVVLIGLAQGFNAGIYTYLFGSILTVQQSDVWIIVAVAVVVGLIIAAIFKELVFSSFDEEAAQVSGIPTKEINLLFIILAALTIAVAIPVVGALLVAALMVIPVIIALQFRKGFLPTLIIAETFSIVSVISGILLSFYFNLATGGTIVLVAIALFAGAFLVKRK